MGILIYTIQENMNFFSTHPQILQTSQKIASQISKCLSRN